MKYDSLYRRYKDQDPRTVFAAFLPNTAAGESWEGPFERLARLAKEEEWHFRRLNFNAKYEHQTVPVLTNYLNYTFLRLQDEGKIRYSAENDKACFNTGLQTDRGKDIFATFFKNKRAAEFNQSDWTLYAFVDSYSDKLEAFHPLPEIARYIYDVNDLVFNTDYSIEANLDHFLQKNEERLPEVLQGNPRMALNVINGAIQSLKGQIQRNYKIAIPHWYDNKIQLLLPLVLTNEEGFADLALVVDRDDSRKMYRGTTILSMDMAYIDARLITKPANEWLNP
jgi:hypothetical protein